MVALEEYSADRTTCVSTLSSERQGLLPAPMDGIQPVAPLPYTEVRAPTVRDTCLSIRKRG